MDERFHKARFLVSALKRTHWETLRSDRNVVGAAFGQRHAHGQRTDTPAMVIYVMKKVPSPSLPPGRRLPRRMYLGGDCVEVDVVETGPFFAYSFTARERPAVTGISVGHIAITAGTIGPVVTDNTDGSACILSNNHVLANENAATVGDAIVQPGPFDGGTDPADRIATLKRFVMINPTGSTVDCAIAQVTANGAAVVADAVKNNLMPTANPNHPAVGLLFAGSCNRTLMCKMSNVVSQLNISFPAGQGSVVDPTVGMNVEKVGRTTEYQTSTITEIDVTATVNYGGNISSATLTDLFATKWMSDPGDSGSLVCQGGAGGAADHCTCGTSSAANEVLGVNLNTERAMADEIRDKFLRQTKIGSFAVDAFFLNEDRLLDRFRRTEIHADDREFARKMYDKYIHEARQAFAEAEKSEQRITDQHIRDARAALSRAHKYMDDAEREAANKLFELGVERVRGKNAKELLALLNDEQLLSQIKDITKNVKSVKLDEGKCE
jgi:hypothetical protein